MRRVPPTCCGPAQAFRRPTRSPPSLQRCAEMVVKRTLQVTLSVRPFRFNWQYFHELHNWIQSCLRNNIKKDAKKRKYLLTLPILRKERAWSVKPRQGPRLPQSSPTSLSRPPRAPSPPSPPRQRPRNKSRLKLPSSLTQLFQSNIRIGWSYLGSIFVRVFSLFSLVSIYSDSQITNY